MHSNDDQAEPKRREQWIDLPSREINFLKKGLHTGKHTLLEDSGQAACCEDGKADSRTTTQHGYRGNPRMVDVTAWCVCPSQARKNSRKSGIKKDPDREAQSPGAGEIPTVIRSNVIVSDCCCLVIKSCLTLCNPMDCSPPASSVHGIFYARILE